ncbi:MAG TPA: MoaD/ThiS family protein [Candidatus Bathyarchaeia archaeon]|nr:MoaD/ThiS family protein [Candidatus Bathyarchaeia archaeon]
MQIEVRLFALLAQYLPPGSVGDGASLDVPAGTTVEEVVERLKIPAELSCMTVVNGHDAPPSQVLAPGDVLSMFPPLAGGV